MSEKRTWFARLKAWWTRPVDMSRPGYNDPRFAIPCHKPTVMPPPVPGARRDTMAFDVCKIAADLSACTCISPGEALEMIRKAGNFGSQEEIDRLRLENADLRQGFEGCTCGKATEGPTVLEKPRENQE